MVNGSRILIADDEPRICKSLNFFLKNAGYETMTASCGSEALALVEKNKFDLFLIDKQMPDMDGIRLMDLILEGTPEAFVIIMTGNASVDSAVTALKKGAYDYLKKPFEYEDLIKTVKNALHYKNLKEENRAMAGRLDISEKRYREMVQNSPDLIYTLDGEGCFLFVNDTFFRLLGYLREEVAGRPYLNFVHADDIRVAEKHVNDVLTGTSSESVPKLRLKCAPGFQNRRPCLTVELKSSRGGVGSLANEHGNCEEVFVIARDISYRKELEDQLRHAQKMDAIGTLAGGIAHDFNNLLMSIQGYTSLLSNELREFPSHVKKLSAVEKQVIRGSELTRQLLGFARGGRHHVQPTNLNLLVRETANMFGRTNKEIGICFDLEKEIWPVEVDRGQIEQVLLNLLLNASQAMPGGGEIEIQTQNVLLEGDEAEEIGKKAGRYVVLSVSDNGCGMDEETLKRIFDPFFTTKDRKCRTGLGLASVYGIVKAHKGAIKVSTNIGLGSLFSIYLRSSEKKPDRGKKEGGRIIKRDDRVLLVDDEPEVLGTTKKMLESIGLKVITAENGGLAVKRYRENRDSVDLVILDLIMPGIGGGDTFDDIKKINPGVKVILSSGGSRCGEAENIIKRGCNGFIQKPYTMARISEIIDEILGPVDS